MGRTHGRSAYVVGSGPNGLAAAIVLARAGFATTLLEAQPNFGGGMRCAELTLPGFIHDVCSAVHPLAVSSPIFQSCPLEQHGLKWIHPEASFAHPLDDGSAVVIEKSVAETANRLGRDRDAWTRAFDPMVRNWQTLVPDILRPVQWPSHPVLFARFGMRAPWPATLAARALFQTEAARAAFAGAAAHSIMPLESVLSGAFGWVLTICRSRGRMADSERRFSGDCHRASLVLRVTWRNGCREHHHPASAGVK